MELVNLSLVVWLGGVRIGMKLSQIGTKLDKFGTFIFFDPPCQISLKTDRDKIKN